MKYDKHFLFGHNVFIVYHEIVDPKSILFLMSLSYKNVLICTILKLVLIIFNYNVLLCINARKTNVLK